MYYKADDLNPALPKTRSTIIPIVTKEGTIVPIVNKESTIIPIAHEDYARIPIVFGNP